MTLIITSLSELGITMIGDTTFTENCLNANRTMGERAFMGLIKVIPVQKLPAGLAYWGWTKMPPDQQKGVWFDWWLQNLVNEKRDKYNSLEDLAHILETELQNLVPPFDDRELKIYSHGNGGIHLAGYEKVDGTPQPCFWHIHNGEIKPMRESHLKLEIDPHIVNANCYYPAQKPKPGQIVIIQSGDIETYTNFFRYFSEFYDHVTKDGMLLLPSLVSHAEFWSAQIRFISALYEASGRRKKDRWIPMVKSIGDQITTFTIDANGNRNYFTR